MLARKDQRNLDLQLFQKLMQWSWGNQEKVICQERTLQATSNHHICVCVVIYSLWKYNIWIIYRTCRESKCIIYKNTSVSVKHLLHLSQICVSSVTTSTLEGRPRADPSSRLCMMHWTVLLRGWVWPNTDRPYLGLLGDYSLNIWMFVLSAPFSMCGLSNIVTCQTSWLDFCNSFKTQAETLLWQAVYFFRLLLSPGVVKIFGPRVFVLKRPIGKRKNNAIANGWEYQHWTPWLRRKQLEHRIKSWPLFTLPFLFRCGCKLEARQSRQPPQRKCSWPTCHSAR